MNPHDAPLDVGAPWVTGRDPFSDSLVLASRDTVQHEAAIGAAAAWARTWGQFFGILGSLGGSIEESIREAVRYPDFRSYYVCRAVHKPQNTLDACWREYCDLAPLADRPPMPHEELRDGDLDCWQHEHGYGREDLRQSSLNEIPVSILREFATIELAGPIGGGDFVHIPLERKEELIDAMRDLGEDVAEDQELIAAAQNVPQDPEGTFRRVFMEEMMARYAHREANDDASEWWEGED